MKGQTMTKSDELLTKQEAADILRCSVKTVTRMIERKELKIYKPNGKVLLKRSELYKRIEGSSN